MQKISKAKLKAKIIFKIKNFIAMLPYHFLVMGNVAIFSFIFNKWLEAIIFLTAFFSLRYKFKTTFHAKSVLNCMIITNVMFVLSVILSPSASSYIFGGLVFAYLDAFLLWYIQSKQELKEDKEFAEKLVVELNKKLKEYENPYNELITKCRKASLSQRDTEIAIKYYYEKQTPKEIWLWLCNNKMYEPIEWDSVHQLLWRIGRKLNKN